MSEQQSSQQHLQEELSAYLDGELDADSVREIEQRLARDAAYRAELQQLERAWNLLDRLPRAAVADSFTKTTIEMVAVAAGEEARAIEKDLPRRRRRQQIGGSLALVAAGLVGFAIGHWAWPNPNRQLLEDLKVLENLEFYYQADNIDFLQLLDREGVFTEGDGDHAS
jgi:anti-sigma factor RsiW